MRRTGFAMFRGAALLLVLSAQAAAEEDRGREVGYVAMGPMFDLPAGVRAERHTVSVSIHSVRLAYVFKSSGRQAVHFSFMLPEMPVDASPDAAAAGE